MFYDQLKALCKEKRTTPTAFVINELGFSSSKITAWKNGSIPKYGTLEKIADFFQVPISFLFEDGSITKRTNALDKQEQKLLDTYQKLNDFDKGKLIERAEVLAELATERAAQEAEKVSKEKNKGAGKSKPSVAVPAADEEPDQDEEFYIDLCNLPVSAGTGVYLDEGYTEPLQIRRTAIAERANYAVRVSGDSMETKFYDGDIVLVETCPYVEVGEIGIFIVNDEGFIKKRGEDRLISLNPKCDDVIIHEYDTVYCRGRVLGKAEIVE